MIDILATSLSGLTSSRQRMMTHANNIANMNTPAFQAQRADTATAPNGNGARVDSVTTSTNLGSLHQTGDPTDLAIVGKGYFQVADSAGNLSYTRDGNFTRNAQGLLATPDGLVLQPEIEIPQNAQKITVSEDGMVSATVNGETQELGQISVSSFTNEEGLLREAGNRLAASGASGMPRPGIPGTEGRGYILSGYQENSNVDITREMISLREEESITKANLAVIKTADEMQQELLKI